MEFTKLIRDESAKLQQLHAAVHTTWVHKDRDAKSRRAWSDACNAFHTYASAIDRQFDRACDERQYSDREVIEFSICFLDVDPRFFRSGYLKQELLTRLKRSLVNMIYLLASLNRYGEAIRCGDETVALFGTATDPSIVEQVRRAKVNQANARYLAGAQLTGKE